MFERYYDKLAELLLYAVSLKAGDKIRLTVDVDCREIALRVAVRAYEGGARYVGVEYHDEQLQAAAIRGTAEGFWFPAYFEQELREIVQPGWKLISVRSHAGGDAFEGLPVERSTAYFRALQQLRHERMRATMANRVPWTVTYVPSLYLARQSFPELPAAEGKAKYWEAIVAIMQLDAEDPREIWSRKMVEFEQRAKKLEELDVDRLHFTGPGTDLTVAVNRDALWIGGFDVASSGERFMSNVPTEEVFTSPDYRRVEGRVRLTRPFVMHQNLGPIPHDAWVEFRDGRVVDFGAAQGKETLEAFFELDDRARYAGEIALVDPASPIAATGVTFYNGLYDENAACHLAFGKAYPFTLREQRERSDEELLAMGMNVARVHEDAMIGGPEVDVAAVSRGGARHDLIRGGRFLL